MKELAKTRAPMSLFVAMMLLSLACTTSQTVVSIPQAKLDLKSYIDSGRYSRDVEAVVRQAKIDLIRSLDGIERAAIVLDIDETSLSNLEYELRTNFCYTSESWAEFVAEASAPALEPTLDLYNYAREQGVAVFFVTGRRERFREDTARNLRAAGYTDWQRLYLKANDYDLPSAATYKTASRQEIVDEGYTIVLNMGDQPSDLHGGLAKHAVKLPNPFYGVP
jgi:acid phosphatase